MPMIWSSVTHAETAENFGGTFSLASMALLMSDHVSTHVDAWTHMSSTPDAESVDEMSLDAFVAVSTAIDVSRWGSDEVIGPGPLLEALDKLRSGIEGVILRTGAVPEPCPSRETYMTGFPALTGEAVNALAQRGVRLLGTDARSIDTAGSEKLGADALPAHKACLARRVVVIENLLVPHSVCGRIFELWALPLKIAGGTGAPVRAVAKLVDSAS